MRREKEAVLQEQVETLCAACAPTRVRRAPEASVAASCGLEKHSKAGRALSGARHRHRGANKPPSYNRNALAEGLETKRLDNVIVEQGKTTWLDKIVGNAPGLL